MNALVTTYCTVRPMTIVDEPAVLALAKLCHPDKPPFPARWYATEHRTLVAERDGQIVGYTVYGMTPDWHAFGRDVGVHPDYRNRGIGSQLHGGRLIEAQQRGASHFIGTTEESNVPMVKILEDWGALPTIKTPDGQRAYVLPLGG